MPTPAATEHVDATVQELAALYTEHDRATGPTQRFANRVTTALARPTALVVIFGLLIAWTIGNYVAELLGSAALERFPFPDLGFVATVAALLVALLILTTQRHEQELAERRALLTLQVAVLSEKKIAKVIALLEEQRRDNPMLRSRVDAEAMAMSTPSDSLATLDQLDRVANAGLSELS